MKTFTKMAAQGDFIIQRISDLPKNVALEQVKPENGQIIVAHSETGHNHVMEAERVQAFVPAGTKEADIYEIFLLVGDKGAEINHLRSFDTHETLGVSPGVYRVRRQREYTPEGFRRAAD